MRPGKKIFNIDPPTRSCDDPNCPWHGTIRVRGKIMEAKVIKYRAQKMAVVEREYLVYVPKYLRYERRRSRIHVHVPPCIDVREGDMVIIGETRPIAKTVAFVVLRNLSAQR